VKAFAARIAGVSERCIYKRSREDPVFAERKQLAYEKGTYALEQAALARVTDPIAPSDAMLMCILSARARSDRRGVLQEDPGAGWLEYCTPEEKRVVSEMKSDGTSRKMS